MAKAFTAVLLAPRCSEEDKPQNGVCLKKQKLVLLLKKKDFSQKT